VVQARVAASSGSVDERVRVEAGFHGQCGLGEAVEVRQGDTPALAELTDVPDWYMPREDNLVEGIARFGPGVARRLIWRTSSATAAPKL
jgi:hypothetical protein